VLSNHDVVRHVTRLGGGALGRRRARAATMLSLALPGGAYVYQGEELGLEEVLDIPAELRQDPIFARTGGERIGRDGCRVPLPWSGDAAPFGFGPSGTPWLPQPADWASQTVAAQEADPGSTLHFYRTVLHQRRRETALGDGTLEWLEDTVAGSLAFRRGTDFACAVNYADEPAALPASLRDATVLVASSPDAVLADGTLAGNSAVWLRRAG
jgi:alpha-glucosidase